MAFAARDLRFLLAPSMGLLPVVGYAQDHEGYLLLPEDWLSGGATGN